MTNKYIGVALQTLILELLLILASAEEPPGLPVITAPNVVFENSQVTLICSSSGGDPPPSVTWYRGVDNSLIVDQSYTTSNGVTTNDFTFVAERSQHLAVYECQVDNKVLRSPLLETVYFSVYVQPSQPILSGPSFLTFGSTYQWTCTSVGGIPAATVTFRIGNIQFTSGASQSIAQQSDNTFTTFGFLSWSPPLIYNGQTLFCDVRHPETLGNSVQTRNLQLIVNAEPNQPTLTGPATVTVGATYQWVCISTGGLPAPSMTLRIGNVEFTSGITHASALQSDRTYTVTTVLSWAPNLTHTGQVLYCFVEHQETRGSSLLIATLYLTVNAEPSQPTLNGPTTITFGSVNQWTCTSTGGRPAPIMTLRIGNTQINSQLTQSSVLQSDNTYTVTSILTWAPDASYNGQILYCDVQHQQTRGSNLQSASLLLTVNAQPKTPSLTGPTTVILGVTNQWTCITSGGNPAPILTFRIESTQLTNGISYSFTLMPDNTFTVTSVLSWSPNTLYHGRTLSCDVIHRETLGNNSLTASLLLAVYAQPNQPTLIGPTTVIFGTTGEWTCNSTGGNPSPTLNFRVENTQFTAGVTRSSYLQIDNTYIVSSVLEWTPGISDHGRTLFCDVEHQETRGSNLQTASLQLIVNVEPNQPILTGPNIVTLGSTHQWTCNSSRGRPAQTLTMRIENNQFSIGVTQTTSLEQDNTYTVVGLLTWAPNLLNNNQMLYCDVLHEETRGNNLQTASVQLAVYAEPSAPSLTGPTEVTVGTTNQWTCTSMGGSPAPTLSLYIGNNQFTSGVTHASNLQSDNTYIVTSVLSWLPSLSDNAQNISCVVRHQETLGGLTKTADLQLRINAEPNPPILTGPTAVTQGSSVQWTCTSTGGSPAPTMTLRLGGNQVTTNVIQTSVLQSDLSFTVTSVLSWAPSLTNNGQTLYCDVMHQETRGNNLQTVSLQLRVKVEPTLPNMTGPGDVIYGQTYEWKCVSTGGSPAPVLTFRVGDNQITTGVSLTSVLQADNTYTVTAVLSWTPSVEDVGKKLYCDAQHDSTRVQSSNIDLVVVGRSMDPESVLSPGEIAAICLGILILFLMIIFTLCCCYLGACGYLCGRKKKRVTPEPIPVEPKILKVEIPRFYEFEAPSVDYEIRKTVLVTPRRFRILDPTRTRSSKHTTMTGVDRYPGKYYTFDKVEELRRIHKKNKKKTRIHNDNSNDKEILVGEITDSIPSETLDRKDQDVRKTFRDVDEIVMQS